VLAEIELKKERSESARRSRELAEAFHSYLADCTKKGTCVLCSGIVSALLDMLECSKILYFQKKAFILTIALILTVERYISSVQAV